MLTAIFLFIVLMSPQFAGAATAEELQRQIAALLEQIKFLQAQLAQVQEQPVEWCHNFNVNLKVGDIGDEVVALHMALDQEGFSVPEDNFSQPRHFNETTASAVTGFQQKYRDEILTPSSLKFGTGFVGKATRAKLNKLYGCKVKPSRPPVTPPEVRPSITVISPNGKEVWVPQFQGGYAQQIVKWHYINGGNVDGYLYRTSGKPVHQFCEFDSCRDVVKLQFSGPASTGQTTILLPENIIAASDYRIHLSLGKPDADREVARDDSDASFSIVEPTKPEKPVENQPPIIHGVSGPTALQVNETGTWEVKASDADNEQLNYAVIWGDEVVSAAERDALWTIRVRQSAAFTHSYVKPNIYNPTFRVTDPHGGVAETSISVNVSETAVQKGDIKISVKDTDTWALIYNAKVSVYDENNNLTGVKYTTGGLAGFYNLPVGLYTAVVDADGYGGIREKFKIIANTGGYLTVYLKRATATAPSITVVSPNGGEKLYKGTSFGIIWKTTPGISEIYIKLRKGSIGDTISAVSDVIPNTSYYKWVVPSDLPDGDDYTIRVISADGKAIDDSDAPFKIAKQQSITINVSSMPPAQNVVAGSQNFEFAKFVFDASQSSEDIKITSIPIRMEASQSGTQTNITNLRLFDGSTILTSGIYAINPSGSGTILNPIFYIDPNISLKIIKGTSKTLSLKGDIGGNAAANSAYRFGLASDAKIDAVGITSGQAANVNISVSPGNWMTVVSSGSYSVFLDASSPVYKIVSAGTTGVELSRLKFTASAEEDIDIKRVAFQLSGTDANTPNDLAARKIILYDGTTNIGEAIFAAGDYTTSTLLNFKIPKNSSKIMTIKGDIAIIDPVTGPITAPGDLLKVDYDGHANGMANGNYGIGISSGMNISPSSPDTSVPGVKIESQTSINQTTNLANVLSGIKI